MQDPRNRFFPNEKPAFRQQVIDPLGNGAHHGHQQHLAGTQLMGLMGNKSVQIIGGGQNDLRAVVHLLQNGQAILSGHGQMQDQDFRTKAVQHFQGLSSVTQPLCLKITVKALLQLVRKAFRRMQNEQPFHEITLA